MKRVLVIADDLSGAAEIAGIGFRFGLPTRLVRGVPQGIPRASAAETGVTVIDTDSRVLPAAEAAGLVRGAVERCGAAGLDLVFKKTDSALRGSIVAEVEATLDALGYPAALLVPQNPSRGRTIQRGRYLIDGVPLHETPFANDPIHPAGSADVLELLGRPRGREIRSLEPGSALPTTGITVGGAGSFAEMLRWAEQVTGRVLPVGGADFWQAILQSRGLEAIQPMLSELPGRIRLFVCGSASRDSLRVLLRAESAGIPVCAMRDDRDDWYAEVLAALEVAGVAVIFVGRAVDRTPGAAQRIEEALAEVTARVLSAVPVDHLLLEGGATASAICRRLDWSALSVCGELATGVVQMRIRQGDDEQRLVVKPGSYLWPEAVWH